MAVISRSDLEASPLADLHAIAGQIGLDGFRRLRKAELIETILERHGGGHGEDGAEGESGSGGRRAGDDSAEQSDVRAGARRQAAGGRSSGGRSGGGRSGRSGAEGDRSDAQADGEGEQRQTRRGRQSRSTGRQGDDQGGESSGRDGSGDRAGEGSSGGSARGRAAGGTSRSRDGGSSRARDGGSSRGRDGGSSSRTRDGGSSSRADGRGEDAQADPDPYDTLGALFPTELVELGSSDPVLQEIEALAPFGLGSRVAIVGSQMCGKTETVRSLVGQLAGREGVAVRILLLGVRPEEIPQWRIDDVQLLEALDIAAGAESQTRALDRAVQEAKAEAVKGQNVVLAIDSLEGMRPPVARRALAAARNIDGGGSLTLLATATRPFGGETTVIALDGFRASGAPALNRERTATIKPELLVGDQKATEIHKARSQAAEAR